MNRGNGDDPPKSGVLRPNGHYDGEAAACGRATTVAGARDEVLEEVLRGSGGEFEGLKKF